MTNQFERTKPKSFAFMPSKPEILSNKAYVEENEEKIRMLDEKYPDVKPGDFSAVGLNKAYCLSWRKRLQVTEYVVEQVKVDRWLVWRVFPWGLEVAELNETIEDIWIHPPSCQNLRGGWILPESYLHKSAQDIARDSAIIRDVWEKASL